MSEIIRPSDLPAASSVGSGDVVPIDNGASVRKATMAQIVASGFPIASQAEAIAGVNNSTAMTPLRTKQAMESGIPALMQPWVDQAQAWAESSAPPNPGDPSSKSAKSWAEVSKSAAAAISGVVWRESIAIDLIAGQKTYALAYDPGNDRLMVTLNGQVLEYGQDYILNGASITLLVDGDLEGSRLVYVGGNSDLFVDPQYGYAPTPIDDMLLRVPSQYPDLQSAVEYALKFVPANYRITIRIDAGHRLTKGLRLVDVKSLGDIRITSVDPVVYVASDFVPVSSSEIPGSDYALACFVNTDAPQWNIRVDMTGTSGVDGLMCYGSTRVLVGRHFGVNNAKTNLEVRGGVTIIAPSTNWNGSQVEAVRITSAARAEMRDSTAHDAFQSMSSENVGAAAVLVSRGSYANLQGFKVYRSRCSAFTIRRSYVSLLEADVQELNYGGWTSIGRAIDLRDGAIVAAASLTVDGVLIRGADTSVGYLSSMTVDGIIFDGRTVDSDLNLINGEERLRRFMPIGGGGASSDAATFPSSGSRYWPILNLYKPSNQTEARIFTENAAGAVRAYLRLFEASGVAGTSRFIFENELVTSKTDNTANRILKTGSGGICGGIDTPNINLDAEYYGFWANGVNSQGPTVRPDGLTGDSRWAGATFGSGTSNLAQLAVITTNTRGGMYFRKRSTNGWAQWGRVVTTNDQLTAITATPEYRGQEAYVAGVKYEAFGTTAATDWVPVAWSNKAGTTANRPTTGLFAGRPYLDTTLNKPITWNGTAWIDATGVVV